MMAIYGMLVWAGLMTVAVICLGMMVRGMKTSVNVLWSERLYRKHMEFMRLNSSYGKFGTVADPVGFGDTPPPSFMDFGIAGDKARQDAWEESNRTEFVTCGVCGKNAQLMPDRFTLFPHDCDDDFKSSYDKGLQA